MAAPEGTRANRWNQMVNAVADEMGWTTDQADTYLNAVWANRYTDESGGDLLAHERMRKWLEFNMPDAPTLPVAMNRWLL